MESSFGRVPEPQLITSPNWEWSISMLKQVYFLRNISNQKCYLFLSSLSTPLLPTLLLFTVPWEATRHCWWVSRRVRPEPCGHAMESRQGSPPLPCCGRHRAARAGGVLLKHQDLSSGEKARRWVSGCALKFPPLCRIVGCSVLYNCTAPRLCGPGATSRAEEQSCSCSGTSWVFL